MPVALRDVVALTKPRLSLLVVITFGGALLLAPGSIGLARSLVALVATTLIVGAANALNCYLERDLDRHMNRTRTRPLPAGRLDPRVALVLAFACSLFAVPALTLAANPVTALLGVVALASYVLVYTPMKQKSALALWVGGVPGAIPPLMGWTAVTGHIDWRGAALFAILFCWQIPHFIAIAMFRSEDYARAGHKTLPSVVGVLASKAHAVLWSVLLVAFSLVLYPLGIAGVGYTVAAGVLGAGFLTATFAGITGDERRWGKNLFYASLAYLTLLFVALSLGAR
jgi:protoheme IX farnesyltransferase